MQTNCKKLKPIQVNAALKQGVEWLRYSRTENGGKSYNIWVEIGGALIGKEVFWQVKAAPLSLSLSSMIPINRVNQGLQGKDF